MDLFDRFTERGLKALGEAVTAARALDHAHVGTGHILLGLLSLNEESPDVEVLASLRITAERVHRRLARVLRPDGEPAARRLQFASEAKELLELTLTESLSLGQEQIGSEHLLLALLGEPHSVGSRILHDLGVRPAAARTELLRRLTPAGVRNPVHPIAISRRDYERCAEPLRRFDERAWAAVELAQSEARELEHHHIGVEHLLVGLLRTEEGGASQALRSFGVTAERVRTEGVRIVGRGDSASSGTTLFSPQAKQALERSLREALSAGQNSVGPEQLLLAIMHERDGVAARILTNVGADPERVRDEVARLVGHAR